MFIFDIDDPIYNERVVTVQYYSQSQQAYLIHFPGQDLGINDEKVKVR